MFLKAKKMPLKIKYQKVKTKKKTKTIVIEFPWKLNKTS